MVKTQDSDEDRYPAKEYNKTIFNFTQDELRELTSLNTIVRMGQIAQVMIASKVREVCLVRVGIKNVPDVGVMHDITKGTFFTYVPKVWCLNCGVRKAVFEYKGKFYCEVCAKLAQVQNKPVKVNKSKK